MARGERGLGFSIELESKDHVSTLSLSERGSESVLDETKGEALWIEGFNGMIRVDMAIDELLEALGKNLRRARGGAMDGVVSAKGGSPMFDKSSCQEKWFQNG